MYSSFPFYKHHIGAKAKSNDETDGLTNNASLAVYLTVLNNSVLHDYTLDTSL